MPHNRLIPSGHSKQQDSDSYGNPLLGISIGPTHVGWAVTDQQYNILKFKRKSTWGIHLFDKAKPADERKRYRIKRRRIDRRNHRIELLRQLFPKDITINDDHRFPTIHHLRRYLMEQGDPDISLLYRACHHIIKYRGHFHDLTNHSGVQSFDSLVDAMLSYLSEHGIQLSVSNNDQLLSILSDNTLSITDRKRSISKIIEPVICEKGQHKAICNLLSGASADIGDIFDISKQNITLNDELPDNIDDGILDSLQSLKDVYDHPKLYRITSGFQYISDYRIHLYEKHRSDLTLLKDTIRSHIPDRYNDMFKSKHIKGNYCSYVGSSGCQSSCNQEEFCKYCESLLSKIDLPEHDDMMSHIRNGTFMPLQSSRDNSIIPNSMHHIELIKILDNAERYHPFLLEKDESDLTIKEKILQLHTFHIPYYVGPLGKGSRNAWTVRRTNEPVTPWNFESVIDIEATAEAFMGHYTKDCQYIRGEKVLPKDSLIDLHFRVYDELNHIRVNGSPLSKGMKWYIIRDLFMNGKDSVSRKDLQSYLGKDSEITGLGNHFRTSFVIFHRVRSIIGDRAKDLELYENIIRTIAVFGERERIRSKLSKDYSDVLTEDEIDRLSMLRTRGWSDVSERFLRRIYDLQSERNIIQLLRDSDLTFEEILSTHSFMEQVESINLSHPDGDIMERSDLTPTERKSLRRTMAIIDDIVGSLGHVPKKVFLTLGDADRVNVDTFDRMRFLTDRLCSEDHAFIEILEKLDDTDLRRRSLFLWFTQLGRCMYCGEEIDISDIDHMQKDHIIPRSRKRDDDIYDNLVLSCPCCNDAKGNSYPISKHVRNLMSQFWDSLLKKGLITPEKHHRLVRSAQPTEKELSGYIGDWMSPPNRMYATLSESIHSRYGKDIDVIQLNNDIVSNLSQRMGYARSPMVNHNHRAKDAYLSIIAGNVHLTKFTKDPKHVLREEEYYNLDRMYSYVVFRGRDLAWSPEFEDTVKRTIRRDDILFTRQPVIRDGALFDDTVQKASPGLIERKRGLPTERYGGYHKARGACYSLVEYESKGNTVRALEPLHAHELRDFDDIGSLSRLYSKRKGVEVKVIVPTIRMDSLIDWNGFPLHIGGRTNDFILFYPALQMLLPDDMYQYCRSLSKYEAGRRRKAERSVGYYGLSKERNIELFDHMMEKCDSRPYFEIMQTLHRNMDNIRDRFVSSDVSVQADILMEVLHAFHCDQTYTRLKAVGGPGRTGQITLNCRLPQSVKGIYLVNQSPSGLNVSRVRLDM